MQPISTRFHRSMYVTLSLACTCLGYAELELLPEISAFAAVVLVLLAVAYRVEGRWSLTIGAANVIGGVIAALAVVWLTYQVLRLDGLFEQLPWPAKMLPFLGPLLMILVPAKLFRPKHNGDFWGLHGIGLIAVALGCALTGDPLFGVLFLAYLVSAIWSLTLFYYYRQGQGMGIRDRPAARPPALARAARWAGGVLALALVLFLVTPRVTEARWDLTASMTRLQTGVDDNRPGIDLNRSGTLTVNRDRVFEVRAFTKDCDNPPPKLDVDPGQRWRQMYFNHYDHGKWVNQDAGTIGAGRPVTGQGGGYSPSPLADLGPGQYYFEFHLTRPLGYAGVGPQHVLAEPIASRRKPNGDRRVIQSPRPPGQSRFSWAAGQDADAAVPTFAPRAVYDQVVLPTEEPGVSPPERIDEGAADALRQCQAVPRLQLWSRHLLNELVAQGRLPQAVLGARPVDPRIPAWVPAAVVYAAVVHGWLPHAVLNSGPPADRVPPEHYEAVCRAFEAYLSRSGQFKYTMTLTRKDTEIDPIEDFVLNTREGHCTRFATALALMLRSVGVPSQVVLGYRGFETTGNGLYEVLQCHAHSWVEAVIYRKPRQPEDSPWRWLSLDPTPAGEETADSELTWTNWWEHTCQGVSVFFRNFIVGYDADQQERARAAVSESAWWSYPRRLWAFEFRSPIEGWVSAGLLGGAGLVVVMAGRRVLRRRRTPDPVVTNPGTEFYDRLLAVLGRGLGLAPVAGQTAREFAAQVAGRLRLAPATIAVADIPPEGAAMYYSVRFGDRPMEPPERQAWDARLDMLTAAIKKE